MKKFVRAMMMSVLVVLMAVGISSAYSLTGYVNITANDGYASGTGWYGAHEDQETEPGTATGQMWDLEGIFYNPANGNVAIVGGWNFKDGAMGYTYEGPDRSGKLVLKQIESGDVFIFNSPYSAVGYGVHLDFTGGMYSIYELEGATLTHTSYISQSNPYRFTGGTYIDIDEDTDTLKFFSGLSDDDVGGFLGGSHYMIVLNALGLYGSETIHFTYECGNDMIKSAPVPEPATLLLLGLGLLGLGITRRK